MSASEQQGKPSMATAAAKESRDPEQIREEIEQTREELGDTVVAMAEKTDLKQQVQRLAREKPVPLAFAGGFLTGVVFGRLRSR